MNWKFWKREKKEEQTVRLGNYGPREALYSTTYTSGFPPGVKTMIEQWGRICGVQIERQSLRNLVIRLGRSYENTTNNS